MKVSMHRILIIINIIITIIIIIIIIITLKTEFRGIWGF